MRTDVRQRTLADKLMERLPVGSLWEADILQLGISLSPRFRQGGHYQREEEDLDDTEKVRSE